MPTTAPTEYLYTFDDVYPGSGTIPYVAQYTGLTLISGAVSIALSGRSGPLDVAISGAALLQVTGPVVFQPPALFNRVRLNLKGSNQVVISTRDSTGGVLDSFNLPTGMSGEITYFTVDISRQLYLSSPLAQLDNLRVWFVVHEDGITEPYWDQVVLQLHFDGTAGSSATADSSSFARTVTAHGGFSLDSTSPKFGATSGLFNGTDAYLDTAQSIDFSLQQRFTFQGFVKFSSIGSALQTIFSLAPAGAPAGSFTFSLNPAANQLLVDYFGTTLGAQFTAAVGQWYYMAVVASGYTVRISVNGVILVTSAIASYHPPASFLRFGANHSAANLFNGRLDEWRVTNDVDRDADFYPTAPFPTLGGNPIVSVSLYAAEAGQDSFSATVALNNRFNVSVAASEYGSDTASASAEIRSVATDQSSGPSSANELSSLLEIDPIDKFVFDGIQSRFLEVFDTPTVWTTSTDEVRALDRLFPAKQGQSVTYPYAFLKITTWDIATDRRNLRDSALHGVPVTTADDGKSYLAATFLPVNFTVTVKFVTNDFRSVLTFARKWLVSSKTGKLSFQVEYGLTTLSIPLVLDTNVTFPQREGTPEDIQEYVAEVTFSALGYVSDPTIVQVGLVDSVAVSAALGSRADASVISESIWTITSPST